MFPMSNSFLSVSSSSWFHGVSHEHDISQKSHKEKCKVMLCSGRLVKTGAPERRVVSFWRGYREKWALVYILHSRLPVLVLSCVSSSGVKRTEVCLFFYTMHLNICITLFSFVCFSRGLFVAFFTPFMKVLWFRSVCWILVQQVGFHNVISLFTRIKRKRVL